MKELRRGGGGFSRYIVVVLINLWANILGGNILCLPPQDRICLMHVTLHFCFLWGGEPQDTTYLVTMTGEGGGGLTVNEAGRVYSAGHE